MYSTAYLNNTLVGRMGSDCTSPIYYELRNACTFKQLCEDIVGSLQEEWGEITIKNAHFDNRHHDDVKIEFFKGKFVNHARQTIEPDFGELADMNVVEVKAHGGWSYMHFDVIVNHKEAKK